MNRDIILLLANLAEALAQRGSARLARGLNSLVLIETELGPRHEAIDALHSPSTQKDSDMAVRQTSPHPDRAAREAALADKRMEVEEIELKVRLIKARAELKSLHESRKRTG